MSVKVFAPFIIYFVFMVSAVLHEYAHGFIAYRCGDTTARDQGRLTLNPLKHIDPVGSFILPIAIFVLTSSMFGWAKPVPVDFDKVNRKQQFFIAVSGLAVNLVLAAVGLLLFHATNRYMTEDAFLITQIFCLIAFMLFPINLILAVFNSLPVPPMDGWMVLSSLFPKKVNAFIMKKPWISTTGLVVGLFIMSMIFKSLMGFVRDLSIANLL